MMFRCSHLSHKDSFGGLLDEIFEVSLVGVGRQVVNGTITRRVEQRTLKRSSSQCLKVHFMADAITYGCLPYNRDAQVLINMCAVHYDVVS